MKTKTISNYYYYKQLYQPARYIVPEINFLNNIKNGNKGYHFYELFPHSEL